MKILCVHPGYEMYGADRSFARTIAAFRGAFSSLQIAAVLPQDGPITNLDPLSHVDLKIRPIWILRRRTVLHGFSLGLWRNVSALIAAYRDMKSADVIYINTIVVADFIFLARFFKKPVIVHVREIPNGIEMLIFRALLRWSRAKFIFNSQATSDAFALPKKFMSRVVHNGVQVSEITLANKADNNKAQVLMIGRFNHWKGQEILIEAVSKMAPDERARLEVRFVGSTFNKQDDFLKRLHALIEERSLAGVIKIEPFEADPYLSYHNSDLVVVPSRLAEPFGNVAVEAMAFARPVVASRNGGLPEIVREGETGRLFSPGSADELSSILREFLENPDLYRRYGAAGRKRYEKLFTVEEFNRRFVVAIKDLISISGEPCAEIRECGE